MTEMKIVLAGGGTAGHINPALAIAQEIVRHQPDAQILFVGNRDSMEETLVKRAGFEMRFIKIRGLNRKQLHKNITTIKLLFTAIKEAERILREFAPDVVIGTGGYVSGPVLYAATKLGLHTCIHEQNAYPGLTSKLLSRRVEKVFISFENSARYFKDGRKLILTGNPLRSGFSTADRAVSRQELGLREDDFYVVSFGGSLGATVLNRVVAQELALNQESGEFVRCHAMGKLGIGWMPELLKEKGIPVGETTGRFRVVDYIHDMPRQLAAADAVVTRAGAITIGEVLSQGKAAVLIPSPNVTHNHQYHNAAALAEKNAAIMIEEKDLSAQVLYDTLLELKAHPEKCAALSAAALQMAHQGAAATIYHEIEQMLS